MAADSRYPPSPVPSDRHLWPGELPFTAFGQYGTDMLDVRVFEQSTWWVDREGNEHLLTEMEDEYLRNVVIHLVTHREQFMQVARQRALVQRCGDLLLGYVEDHRAAGEMGPDQDSLWSVSALEWLCQTPLMTALCQRAAARGGPVPDPGSTMTEWLSTLASRP